MFKKIQIFISFLFLVSCDISSEDYLSPYSKEENNFNVFYTTPESSLSINPTGFEKLKEAKSLTISQLPKFGDAKFIENGFIYYTLKDKSTTTDNFIIEGKNQSGASISEEIKISFLKNINDLPCYSGAIGDKISLEVEKNTVLDVSVNDKSCNSIGKLQIEIQPKNGKAEVLNDKISYTPTKDFVGEDLFFYRITINNQKNPVAPVEILVNESAECLSGMFDDIINVLNYSAGTELMIDVLQNDKICSTFQNSELRIIKNPENGTLRIDQSILSKPVVMYKPRANFSGQDSFEYALFRTEKRLIKAKVTINFK